MVASSSVGDGRFMADKDDYDRLVFAVNSVQRTTGYHQLRPSVVFGINGTSRCQAIVEDTIRTDIDGHKKRWVSVFGDTPREAVNLAIAILSQTFLGGGILIEVGGR